MADTYQKLPGQGTKREGNAIVTVSTSRCRLWQGEDHLLQVELNGSFVESYRRFYYRDIQAFVMRRTLHGAFGAALSGAFALLLVIFSFQTHDPAGRWTLLGFAFIIALICAANLVAGPTCRCFIKTAVQLEELPSLRRLKRARQVIARLRPAIIQAQGELRPEEVSAQYVGLLGQHGLSPEEITQRQSVRVIVDLKPYAGRSHLLLFLAMLVDAALSLTMIFIHNLAVVSLSGAASAAFYGAVLIALIRQRETDLKPAVRTVTWTAAGWAGCSLVISYAIFIMMQSGNRYGAGEWEQLKGIAALEPLTTPWWLTILVANTIISGILGLLGLLFLQLHWRERNAYQSEVTPGSDQPPTAPPAEPPVS